MNQIQSQQNRNSLKDETNQSFLTAKSDIYVQSEKGIALAANSSNICGGNLKFYQNDISQSNEIQKYCTEEKGKNDLFLQIIQQHQLYFYIKQKVLYSENITQENYVIARQNSHQYLYTQNDSPNIVRKKMTSQYDNSSQKVIQFDKNVDSSIIDQTNRSQSKQFQSQQNTGSKKKEFKGFAKSINILAFFQSRMLFFYRNFTYSGRTKYMSDEARIKINDICDYSIHQNRKEKFNLMEFTKEQFEKLLIVLEKLAILLKLTHFPLFNPENIYRIIFNSILISYNCFYLIVISLKVFFHAQLGHFKEVFHEIAMAAWITEMLINMNTSTYHKGQFITDRKQIIKIYLHEYFFFEIIPLIFESVESSNFWVDSVLQIPLLLKIKGIMIIYEKIEFFILHSVKRRYILEILKLLFKLILLTHVMACSYNVFLQFEVQVLHIEYTWADLESITDRTWYSDYALAQVWAFTTMCNTTSRQIKTTQEYLFTSFWMLISCIAFAYLINKIGSILTELNSQEDQFRDDINLLNQFMKRKHINLGLQRLLNLEIKQYYKQEELKKEIDVKTTLSRLSKPMYKQLMQESYKKVLTIMPYFKNFVTENNQSRIYEIMEEIGYSAHQVMEDNELENDIAIYYVLKGQQKSQKKSYKSIKVVRSGEFFGMYEFLTGTQRQYVAESKKLSVVIKISLKRFLDIIRNDEQDYQRYLECKDKIIFNKNCTFLDSNCYSCGQNDHYFVDCVQTHFNKNNPFIYPKYNYAFPQVRNSTFIRKQITRSNYFQRQSDDEDEYQSEKSSATIIKNDKTQEQKEDRLYNQFSNQESEKDVEKSEMKKLRNSNQSINIQKRLSLQNQQEYFDERISQDKIIENALSAISANLTRKLSFQDQDQQYIHQKILEQLLSEELLDEQYHDQTNKIKQQKRRISNKGFQNQLRSSIYKRSSVEELNPITKNQMSIIEEIKEGDQDNDSTNYDSSQQINANSSHQLIANKTPSAQFRNSEFFNILGINSNNKSLFFEHPSFRRVIVEWKDSLDYWRFDKVVMTKYYYPDYNFNIILKKLQKIKQKNKPRSRIDKNLNQQSSYFKKYTLQKIKTTTPRSYQFFETKLKTLVNND